MAKKFLAISAVLLSASAAIAAPTGARSEQPKLASLTAARKITPARTSPMGVRCFLGATDSSLAVATRHRGWVCMREMRPDLAR